MVLISSGSSAQRDELVVHDRVQPYGFRHHALELCQYVRFLWPSRSHSEFMEIVDYDADEMRQVVSDRVQLSQNRLRLVALSGFPAAEMAVEENDAIRDVRRKLPQHLLAFAIVQRDILSATAPLLRLRKKLLVHFDGVDLAENIRQTARRNALVGTDFNHSRRAGARFEPCDIV